MASSSVFLGIKELTQEQVTRVEELVETSLFGNPWYDGALAYAAEQKQKKNEQKFLQPYADALLEHLKDKITANRETVFTVMKKDGHYDVLEYLAICYHQTLLEKQCALENMAPDHEEPVDLESTLGIKTWMEMWDGSYKTAQLHRPIKVHRILRSPFFLTRVAMLFGPKFTASLVSQIVDEKEGRWGWTQKQVSVRVTYMGEKIPTYEVEKILKVLDEEKAREHFKLGEKNWLYGVYFHETPPPSPGREHLARIHLWMV
jgi:hypothetical protein